MDGKSPTSDNKLVFNLIIWIIWQVNIRTEWR
ncbi:hypothetical protein TorRG33x02_282960 [Trema orientale]|uniref:Uncharacterized protein n=1 Tax=Trema orientale TaxID=63057 RepID=A0A2P5CIU9_TREOI|nr:hypothetical protein TorRG33x02_282960 [Trema orientale]